MAQTTITHGKSKVSIIAQPNGKPPHTVNYPHEEQHDPPVRTWHRRPPLPAYGTAHRATQIRKDCKLVSHCGTAGYNWTKLQHNRRSTRNLPLAYPTQYQDVRLNNKKGLYANSQIYTIYKIFKITNCHNNIFIIYSAHDGSKTRTAKALQYWYMSRHCNKNLSGKLKVTSSHYRANPHNAYSNIRTALENLSKMLRILAYTGFAHVSSTTPDNSAMSQTILTTNTVQVTLPSLLLYKDNFQGD